jgi:DNA-binding IclR family transcriptional regulator
MPKNGTPAVVQREVTGPRPLYATGAGRVLLAFADKLWQEELRPIIPDIATHASGRGGMEAPVVDAAPEPRPVRKRVAAV